MFLIYLLFIFPNWELWNIISKRQKIFLFYTLSYPQHLESERDIHIYERNPRTKVAEFEPYGSETT